MRRFLLFALVMACASALPMESFSDEVELVHPTNTNGHHDSSSEGDFPFGADDETGIPILIVHTNRGGSANRDPLFPFLNTHLRDAVDHVRAVDRNIPLPGFGSIFDSILGPRPRTTSHSSSESDSSSSQDGSDSTSEEEVDMPCGLLCMVLRQFDQDLRRVQHDVTEMRRKQQEKENEIDHDDSEDDSSDQDDDSLDLDESTYEEKVLPDGTVVKVNRTVISDASDDGTSFFFHSTSFHNVGTPSEGDTSAETDESAVREKRSAQQYMVRQGNVIGFRNMAPVNNYNARQPFSQQTNHAFKPTFVATRQVQPKPERLTLASQPSVFPRSQVQSNLVDSRPSFQSFEQTPQVFHYEQPEPRAAPASSRLVLAGSANPPDLSRDTLVNDLITADANRGALVRIEPESEFVGRNLEGDIVPLEELDEGQQFFQQRIV